jgi:hypothetical protein
MAPFGPLYFRSAMLQPIACFIGFSIDGLGVFRSSMRLSFHMPAGRLKRPLADNAGEGVTFPAALARLRDRR